MMKSPELSVILPVFNGERYLKQAILSVLEQEIDLELIVVDDGSQDASADIANSFGPRVRYIRQINIGVAAARNVGIRSAKAQVLAFIDADDLWPPHKVDHLLGLLSSRADAALAMGKIQSFADDNQTGLGEDLRKNYFGSPFYCYVLGSAVVRAAAFDEVGFMNESMPLSSDMDWFVRVRERLPLVQSDEVSLLYRSRPGSLSFGKDLAERKIFSIIKESLDRRRSRNSGEAEPLCSA